MFKRMLVPLDGSVRAEQALSIAVRLAPTSGDSMPHRLAPCVLSSPWMDHLLPRRRWSQPPISSLRSLLKEHYFDHDSSSNFL